MSYSPAIVQTVCVSALPEQDKGALLSRGNKIRLLARQESKRRS